MKQQLVSSLRRKEACGRVDAHDINLFDCCYCCCRCRRCRCCCFLRAPLVLGPFGFTCDTRHHFVEESWMSSTSSNGVSDFGENLRNDTEKKVWGQTCGTLGVVFRELQCYGARTGPENPRRSPYTVYVNMYSSSKRTIPETHLSKRSRT